MNGISPTENTTRPEIGAFVLSLFGVICLLVVAFHFDVTQFGDSCAAWPTLENSYGFMVIYLSALFFLTLGWIRFSKIDLSLCRVLILGAILHAIALVAPPFLSIDPLNYAATARAVGHFHHSAFAPIREALPPGDQFLALMRTQDRWLGTGYLHGFVAIAALVGKLGGDRLWLYLRLFQAVAALSIGLSAAAIGRARGARAAAVVLFCPLPLIEGTMNAHNDAWLMLPLALCALSLERRRPGLGFLALLSGLLIKATGVLSAGFFAFTAIFRRLRPHLNIYRVLLVGIGGFFVLGLALFALRHNPIWWRLLWQVVGDPDALPRCTRSLECVPRAVLHFGLHRPMIAWVVGLVFRLASALWLLYAAWRAAGDGEPFLAWFGTALFVFLLFFQAALFPWYLMSVVVLLPFASDRFALAMRVFCISSLSCYLVRMPLNCENSMLFVATKEFLEILITQVPPLYVLASVWRNQRKSLTSVPLATPP